MKEKVSLRASFSDGTAKFDVDVQLRSLGFSDWALCYARNFTEIVNKKLLKVILHFQILMGFMNVFSTFMT